MCFWTLQEFKIVIPALASVFNSLDGLPPIIQTTLRNTPSGSPKTRMRFLSYHAGVMKIPTAWLSLHDLLGPGTIVWQEMSIVSSVRKKHTDTRHDTHTHTHEWLLYHLRQHCFFLKNRNFFMNPKPWWTWYNRGTLFWIFHSTAARESGQRKLQYSEKTFCTFRKAFLFVSSKLYSVHCSTRSCNLWHWKPLTVIWGIHLSALAPKHLLHPYMYPLSNRNIHGVWKALECK